jgi:hypothetical protein
LLPRPAELGRKPQQRPQPSQDPLVQVRVQVLRAGRLDQDRAVQVNDPTRRVKVVDRVPRPVQVRRQANGARQRPPQQVQPLRDRVRSLIASTRGSLAVSRIQVVKDNLLRPDVPRTRSALTSVKVSRSSTR